VQNESEALNSAILLLADDENELSRSSPRRPESKTRPWPLRTFPGDQFCPQPVSLTAALACSIPANNSPLCCPNRMGCPKVHARTQEAKILRICP